MSDHLDPGKMQAGFSVLMDSFFILMCSKLFHLPSFLFIWKVKAQQVVYFFSHMQSL